MNTMKLANVCSRTEEILKAIYHDSIKKHKSAKLNRKKELEFN